MAARPRLGDRPVAWLRVGSPARVPPRSGPGAAPRGVRGAPGAPGAEAAAGTAGTARPGRRVAGKTRGPCHGPKVRGLRRHGGPGRQAGECTPAPGVPAPHGGRLDAPSHAAAELRDPLDQGGEGWDPAPAARAHTRARTHSQARAPPLPWRGRYQRGCGRPVPPPVPRSPRPSPRGRPPSPPGGLGPSPSSRAPDRAPPPLASAPAWEGRGVQGPPRGWPGPRRASGRDGGDAARGRERGAGDREVVGPRPRVGRRARCGPCPGERPFPPASAGDGLPSCGGLRPGHGPRPPNSTQSRTAPGCGRRRRGLRAPQDSGEHLQAPRPRVCSRPFF